METLTYFLPQVWFGILALFLFLYVMLDGFDLGVGILSLTSDDEERRGLLMTSLSNIWDANETWLVLMGGGLFGAFPLAYSTILSALYIPIITMVFGFIFRAVAFEFREQAKRKLIWNVAFGAGSFLAALGQGFALGSVLEGIKVDEAGHFIGSTWDWLSWQSILIALTLIQAYVLIGSTYLIWKTEGELQETHYKTARIAAFTTLIGAIFITISTPIFYESARTRLFQQPLVYIFGIIPVVGILLISRLLGSLDRKQERAPFVWTILLFVLTFIGLALVVFPYIIPPNITIYEASADPSSLVIMIIFIGFLIPVMLFYNLYQYVVFRGKVTGGHYGE
ncbi:MULTISPECIES: cytochrome d ubiquinol oxidase subunit II [Chroococcidiopsis]|uniref:Cytochrome bd plastoquinol oxidase subunit 2 apoprotein n=1 Tax=Chroococcidiopsis thermalis (strain PCC 7203) TaxID=251229 RepID=K9TZT0_CHRTP|nr:MULTISPECIES: cytochrome d ubiquinol oxidase subunit II [Chroococcidiopsis]AFY88095.1 cytochrome bd plastoquinol oxidase subunit 2 apoprotein [Chroococcidiopsis thermalis PCC 7203]MBE9017886.1 cytochrome d ubiquinol oxidase subunit II [Chroococcidiopsidales cyanobacterium LEGE 13417]PSB49647.1 cytochrome d ubiquinol oxidase subunit II [Cyanosarcina cf. burmensis CCALA 770]PSM50511.1 cytochrome d ubiquinol oxidase subunit II [Chroococcidiopsis sp. CCALA 051]